MAVRGSVSVEKESNMVRMDIYGEWRWFEAVRLAAAILDAAQTAKNNEATTLEVAPRLLERMGE